uniref:Protein FAR1-RELATED SEQUENCE n=1 Tax=Arundo donax TaxID=35708 RepID=A0A0A9BN26_ARUDO
MAAPSTSGGPAAAGEPAPSCASQEPAQRRHPTSRISHIVRTYLDLSSDSKKRRAAPKSQLNAGGPETTATGDETDGDKAGAVPTQPSRLLRELGIRVSRYTHEERRDIILRYMQKRSGRQVVNRAASKVPSRQALAERRRRGAGGKFLGKEDVQTADKQEEKLEEEPELPPEVVSSAGGVPIVGMVFETEEKAYEYYVSYAGNMGFSVRKGWWDKTSKSATRSRVYVCSREGFRSKNEAKRPRPETRMGCPAHIAVKLTPSGKYRVTEFVEDHNHQLAAPFDIEMLRSQRVLAKVQPGNQNASNIPAGYKNYLRSKSAKDMRSGDLRALMDYFRRMKSDNPSFYYAIQVDENDKAANVFWADSRSITDYHYFCDVICFDMIYKANDLSRPLALFLGMNHHRHMIIFCAAFLYDETVESFKWLFETFKSAMCGKQPKVILTDRSASLKEALALTLPGTIHRSCVWQIYQDTVQSLEDVFSTSEEFTYDFRHCVFDVEDEQEFVDSWNVIMEKYNLKENEWLIKLYEDRENWALPYSRHIFSGDIKSMLQAENFGTRLKEYLGCDTDISLFLKFFESSAEKRRQEEMRADYQANQGVPRINLPLLWQAANLYTPITFELFRKEYELSADCMAYDCGEFGSLSEYMITVKNKTKDQLVRFDSSDCTVACTCKKFENAGLLCCHILKVYELRNVKEIPPQYFLKRWRKDVKLVTMDEIDGFNFDSDTESSVPGRHAVLCRLFYKIAAKAAENIETFALMANQSDQLLAEVERILQSALADKSSGYSIKDQLTHMVQNDYLLSGSNEVQGSTGKKCEVARRRNDLGTNKRKKARKGQPDETEAVPRESELNITPGSIQSEPRNALNQFIPDQLMQGHYVLGHNFGLGSSQNLHDNLNQFGRASVSTLQQQPFPRNGQLTQGYPGDMHALQFVETTPQIDEQNGDQGQSSIPVWDFL